MPDDRPAPAIAPLPARDVPSATDQVFAHLRDAIVRLDLVPGTRISEAEIAGQLGVSRQPVRDAFFRLTLLGLLDIRPQRATRVTLISRPAVSGAAFLRAAIEGTCLRQAATDPRPGDLARLRDILARQRMALDDADPARFAAQDAEFHRALCEIAGQPRAWGVILEHKVHLDRLRHLDPAPGRRRAIVGEHSAIVIALASGDADGAERALRAHLAVLPARLDALRHDHPTWFQGP